MSAMLRLSPLAVLLFVTPLGAQSAVPVAVVTPMPVPAACADSVVPPPEHRLPGSYRPPQRRQIAVPPLEGAAPSRGRLVIEFLVSPRGTVDSVAIRGEVAVEYRRALLATLLTHTFWPATYRGCAVPGRMLVELTLP